MTRYAYLGPQGTFTEMALRSWAPADGAEHVPMGSVDAALAALRAGDVDAAMVPIENSVEGGVSATLDALANGEPLVVVGEVLVPITFVLAAPAGTPLASIRAVGTHPHAWAQVRGWMGEHLPDATYVPALSTAAGAAGLAAGDASYDAAVCAPVAAHDHGLAVLAEGIGDNASAVTRFVLVSRPGRRARADRRRQDDRRALPARRPPGRPARAARAVRRPRGQHDPAGVAADGGVAGARTASRSTSRATSLDERVGETLMGLRRVCAEVRFLGSYPRADGTAVAVRQGTDDGAFLDAREWLRGLRHPG